MHYRRFGKTGLAMPVLSCGGMRYQFKWQDAAPAENQANLEATLQGTLEREINQQVHARRDLAPKEIKIVEAASK